VVDADADADVEPDDPAKHRLILIDDRNEALGSIVLGLLLLIGAVPVLLLSVWTNDTLLLIGSVIVPVALGFGAKSFVSGVASHLTASFRLRQLHSRRTSLPPARLVD
jgi:hypothetical protein